MAYCQRSFGLLRNAVSAGIIILALFEVTTVVKGAPAILQQFVNDVENEIELAGRVDSGTLVLTQVMFRHGNRTPDATTFPKDRYLNFQYPPFGRGQLTLGGKKLAYENGQFLRKRYGQFLGDTLTPEIMSVKSTNYPRTQMTATLVSAGLWPPSKGMQWGEGLGKLFQPTYIEHVDDLVYWGSVWYKNCPAYDREIDNFLKTKQAKSILREFDGFRVELSKHTGLDVQLPVHGYIVYQALLGQKEYGLELPKWFNKTVEDKLYSYVSWSLGMLSLTEKLQRFRAGVLLKEMLSNFAGAATNSLNPKGRKIFMYSAHDVTLSGLLQALKVYDLSVPPYGAMILMELHSISSIKSTENKPNFANGLDEQQDTEEKFDTKVLDLLGLSTSDKNSLSTTAASFKRFGVKLFLKNSTVHEPYPLTMPKCSHLCPLDQFASILAPLIPQNMTAECNK